MTVHFLKWDPKGSMLKGCKRLYEAAGTFDVVEEGDLVAIKLHVGEYGNPNHIRPILVRQIVDEVIRRGGKPFLTDSNTLYKVRRHNAVDHERTAWAHGFMGIAPFVVADGLRGENGRRVGTKGILKEIEVSGAIAEADSMIVVTHAKGHGSAGVGGAIKNLGMGCSTRNGKRAQHQSVGLTVNDEDCEGCGNCVEECIVDAITLVNDKVTVDKGDCMCCGGCVNACDNDTLNLIEPSNINRALASATNGVLSTFKPHKVSFVSFAINISSFCDCASNPGEIVHPDIGVFASNSIISVDSAVINILGEQMEKLHNIDPSIQTRELKAMGIEGDLEPTIVEI